METITEDPRTPHERLSHVRIELDRLAGMPRKGHIDRGVIDVLDELTHIVTKLVGPIEKLDGKVEKIQGVRYAGDGKHCPQCNSSDPLRHPAVQHGGEVHICLDPWHVTFPLREIVKTTVLSPAKRKAIEQAADVLDAVVPQVRDIAASDPAATDSEDLRHIAREALDAIRKKLTL